MLKAIRYLLTFLKWGLCIGVIVVIGLAMTPVQLNTDWRSQYPTLPNGCEAVSAAICLNYFNEYITAETFASQYLPKAAVGTALPKDAYIGDPFSSGYYCYQLPLVHGINTFLSENGNTLAAHSHALTTVTEVALRVHAGKPVICWITVDDRLPAKNAEVEWKIGSRSYKPYKNLHVVTVDGTDFWRLHLQDSVNGDRWIPIWKFLPEYYAMGMRAVYFSD